MSNTESEGDKKTSREELETRLDSAKREFLKRYHSIGCSVWNVLGILVLLSVFLIIYWGANEFRAWLSLGPVTGDEPLPSQTPLPQPLYEVIGAYQHQVYLFNQSTQKVYMYDAQIEQEKESFDLFPYEAFFWSLYGNKIVFISREHNNLGNMYIVDLNQSAPYPELITEREAGINFPSDVVIKGNLPLAWNEDADHIAFVAHKQTEEKDALFVIAADGSEYYRLPEKDRITSLAWADDKIVFVAFENGREKRFVVNFDGGALKEVK